MNAFSIALERRILLTILIAIAVAFGVAEALGSELTIVVNDVTTIHDETAGEQNTPPNLDATTDANGNDIVVSELRSDFSARLVDLGADPASAIGAALSGYDGSNGGSDVFTVSETNGLEINNLALTAADGAPLDGADSELDTTEGGNSIFLYSDDSNDNIVLGREGTGTTADPNGAIVLAIYLEDGSDLKSGKLWTVQYEAILHGVAGDGTTPAGSFDEPLSLDGKVFVTASRDLEFDLTNAPSGQNLFIMFGDGDIADDPSEVGIIATGKNPLDQSANPGTTITAGDTVNTSHGGGDTTFGINNQMLNEGEGIYFTFVSGPEPTYTVPNLDQNEADIEANIDFTDVLDAKAAEFQVVQLQSGKTAVLTISAYSTPANQGDGYIDASGLTGNTPVDILSVEVDDFDGGGEINVVDNGDGTFNIEGVEAGDTIAYFTDGDHNRVLIEHDGDGRGQDSADFDIGGFKLIQADTATAEIGHTVHWEDDGPQIDIELSGVVLRTDDRSLTGGSGLPDAGTSTDTDTLTQVVVANTTAGADGQESLVYSLGVSAVGADSGVDDVATGNSIFLYLESDVVVGRVGNSDGTANSGGPVAFQVSVDAPTGAVTLAQSLAIEHGTAETNAGAPDYYTTDVETLIASAVTLTATLTDGDADVATDTVNIGDKLGFTDDGPDVEFGNLVGTVTIADQIGFWSGPSGADQPGTVTVSADGTFEMVTADGASSTGTVDGYTFDSATGIGTGTLTADFDNDPGSGDENGNETVDFTLTVNADGTYVFTLDEVVVPVVTLSTDEGQLPAGGPDPVQTLGFVDTNIVFFAVDADTAEAGGAFGPADVVPAIELGEPDLTEAELEAGAAPPIGDNTFPFIRDDILMNVSTSGIGVNNNVLQGEDLPGDDPGTINPADSAAFDESFVINPEPLASSVKVFISKTAGGFLPPNLDGSLQGTQAKTDYLYYNVYDELGNSVGPLLVTSDMVSDEADVAAGGTGEALWSFTVDIDDLAIAGDSIDAIQFTMGFGAIKIPKIEIVVKGDAPPNDIFLDFTATLTDADGDMATSAFDIDLYGFDVIDDEQTFDYTLVDAGLNDDAFNAEEVEDPTSYLVQGFVVGDDDLVLLNSAGFTLTTGVDGDGDGTADDSVVTSGSLTVVVQDATLAPGDITVVSPPSP